VNADHLSVQWRVNFVLFARLFVCGVSVEEAADVVDLSQLLRLLV